MPSRFAILSALLLVAPLSTAASAEVIFRDPFTTNVTAAQPASAFGWTAYLGTGADGSATATYFTGTNITTPALGGTNPTAINIPNTRTGTNSFGFSGGGLGSNHWVLYTTTPVAVSIAPDSQDTFSWSQFNRNSTTSTLRALVQVAGNWYVSATLFSTTGTDAANSGGNGDPTTASVETLSFASQLWIPFSYTPGTTFANTLNPTGTAAALPSGSLQAFGWYANRTGTNNIDVRLDTPTITTTAAIPEPAALAALPAAAMLLRRRR